MSYKHALFQLTEVASICDEEGMEKSQTNWWKLWIGVRHTSYVFWL